MKEETGVVVETRGKTAKVKISRHGDCENCGACPGDSAVVLEVQNPLGAKPGQRVVFQISESNMLKAAFVVYVMPLLAVPAGIFAGFKAAAKTELPILPVEVAFGVIVFLTCIIIIKKLDIASGRSTENQPQIIRIV